MEVPEATYLAWVDLSAYFDEEDDLPEFFAYKANPVEIYSHSKLFVFFLHLLVPGTLL